MELRHLRYFAAAAETLHFSRAAERLHVTQPALSRQIRDLEAELGVRLFDRHGTQTALTPAGARFRIHVRDLLGATERAVEAARAAAKQLRFGHYGTLWTEFYGPALRTYARRHPEVQLDAVELTPSELIVALRRGELDLALLGPVEEPVRREFATRRLGTMPAMLAMAADHPLAKRRRLALSELAGQPWIGWDDRSFPGRTALLRDAAKAVGFTPRIVHAVDSVASMFMHLATSAAVGYVLPMSKRLPHSGVVFASLHPPGIVLEMNAAWRRSAESGARLEALADQLASVRFAG